jgi:hypothetical protein
MPPSVHNFVFCWCSALSPDANPPLREKVAIKILKIRYQSVGGTLGRLNWDGKRFGLPQT